MLVVNGKKRDTKQTKNNETNEKKFKFRLFRYFSFVSCLSSYTGKITLFHAIENFIARFVPDFLIENLDFDKSSVTGIFDEAADRSDVDAAIAHHPAPEQHIGSRDEPVAHMKSENSPGRAIDLPLEHRIPPDVLDIDHDADCLAIEFIRQVIGFFE